MKQILGYISLYFKAFPDWRFWLGWGAFLALSIVLRYTGVFDPHFTGYSYPELGQALFYAIPYFFSVGWWIYWYGNTRCLRSFDFWLLSFLIIFALYSIKFLQVYSPYLPPFDDDSYTWYRKLSFNLYNIFWYLLAPLLYGLYARQIRSTQFYGCTAKDFHFSPYLIMLLIMLPLIVWASFQESFLLKYPRYQVGAWEESAAVSAYFTVGVYELSYVVQFIALEIFFRGFIVMALEKHLGKASVFPMVAVYAFLHFYKPMPETLGSIFGGFILGAVAWKSRSVLGGMIVHIGIALMMEGFAFLQLYLQK